MVQILKQKMVYENSHLQITEYLISQGANIEAKDSKIDTANYLVSKGVNENANSKDSKTPQSYKS